MSVNEYTERTLRSGDVAKVLGLSSVTVQGYAREGRVPTSRTPGGQYRFDLEEVRRALFPNPGFNQFHPSRFINPVTSGSFLVLGSTTPAEADPRNPMAMGGYVGEPDKFARQAHHAAPQPELITGILSRPTFDERRLSAKRAMRVLEEAPVAAFAVLR